MLRQKIRSAGAIGLLLCLPGIVPSAQADNPTTVIPLSGRVVPSTCTFNNANQTITLDKIRLANFGNSTTIKAVKIVTVGITCASGISAVKIIPNGQADAKDPTAFKNTGNAGNVGLRFSDSGGVALPPDGSRGVSVTPKNGSGSYNFQAGYVATSKGNVSAGSFTSMVTLSFDYS